MSSNPIVPLGESRHHTGYTGPTGGSTYKYKETAYCAIAIDDGSETWAVHYCPNEPLAEALEAAENLTIIHNGLIEEDDEEHKLPSSKEEIPWLIISPDEIPYTVSKNRSVATCAFTATDTFMKHHSMGGLDQDDREWYTLHHLVTEDGLPQQHTFTVLQQLVEPYGLGINRICVPRNSRRFPEYIPFMEALGCNPFFRVDGHTTNQEALEKLLSNEALKDTSDEKKAEMAKSLLAQWRFECRDLPMSGSILMTQFQTSSVGHNGASTYKGPRAKVSPDNWRMAITLDRLDCIKYAAPLNLPEYKEYEGTIRYDFWKIKDGADGKTLKEISDEIKEKKWSHWKNTPSTFSSGSQSSDSKDDRESKSGSSSSTSGGSGSEKKTSQHGSGPSGLSYPPVCGTCNKPTGLHFQAGVRHCQTCNAKLERNYLPKSGEARDTREYDDPITTIGSEGGLTDPDNLSDEEIIALFYEGRL